MLFFGQGRLLLSVVVSCALTCVHYESKAFELPSVTFANPVFSKNNSNISSSSSTPIGSDQTISHRTAEQTIAGVLEIEHSSRIHASLYNRRLIFYTDAKVKANYIINGGQYTVIPEFEYYAQSISDITVDIVGSVTIDGSAVFAASNRADILVLGDILNSGVASTSNISLSVSGSGPLYSKDQAVSSTQSLSSRGDTRIKGNLNTTNINSSPESFSSTLSSGSYVFSNIVDSDVENIFEYIDARGTTHARMRCDLVLNFNLLGDVSSINADQGSVPPSTLLRVDNFDIDRLTSYIRLGNNIPSGFDLNGDGLFTNGASLGSDLQYLVENIIGTAFGDANLDGLVNNADTAIVTNNMGNSGGWSSGDFDGDGVVGSSDVTLLQANLGFDADN